MKRKTLLLLFSACISQPIWSQDLIKDINAGAASSYAGVIGTMNTGVFFTARNTAEGSEHYITDGTQAGTMLIKDIKPGAGGSTFATYYVKVGNEWFFVARPSADLK